MCAYWKDKSGREKERQGDRKKWAYVLECDIGDNESNS